MDALKHALELKGRLQFRYVTSVDPASCGNPAPAGAHMIDADAFRDGIAALQTLGQNIRLYLDLGRNRKISELQSLANYALNFQLPAEFEQNTNLYKAALAQTRARAIDLAGLRHSLHDALLRAFVAAAAHQYDVGLTSNALSAIHDITTHIDANGAGDPATLELLRDLRDRLAAIEAAGRPRHGVRTRRARPETGRPARAIARRQSRLRARGLRLGARSGRPGLPEGGAGPPCQSEGTGRRHRARRIRAMRWASRRPIARCPMR